MALLFELDLVNACRTAALEQQKEVERHTQLELQITGERLLAGINLRESIAQWRRVGCDARIPGRGRNDRRIPHDGNRHESDEAAEVSLTEDEMEGANFEDGLRRMEGVGRMPWNGNCFATTLDQLFRIWRLSLESLNRPLAGGAVTAGHGSSSLDSFGQ
jgi:hypothetical protein